MRRQQRRKACVLCAHGSQRNVAQQARRGVRGCQRGQRVKQRGSALWRGSSSSGSGCQGGEARARRGGAPQLWRLQQRALQAVVPDAVLGVDGGEQGEVERGSLAAAPGAQQQLAARLAAPQRVHAGRGRGRLRGVQQRQRGSQGRGRRRAGGGSAGGSAARAAVAAAAPQPRRCQAAHAEHGALVRLHARLQRAQAWHGAALQQPLQVAAHFPRHVQRARQRVRHGQARHVVGRGARAQQRRARLCRARELKGVALRAGQVAQGVGVVGLQAQRVAVGLGGLARGLVGAVHDAHKPPRDGRAQLRGAQAVLDALHALGLAVEVVQRHALEGQRLAVRLLDRAQQLVRGLQARPPGAQVVQADHLVELAPQRGGQGGARGGEGLRRHPGASAGPRDTLVCGKSKL